MITADGRLTVAKVRMVTRSIRVYRWLNWIAGFALALGLLLTLAAVTSV